MEDWRDIWSRVLLIIPFSNALAEVMLMVSKDKEKNKLGT